MRRLILMRGPQGSGKSTFAKELLSMSSNMVRINCDDLRLMMFNVVFHPMHSEPVKETSIAILQHLIENTKYSIIMDNMNINSEETILEFMKSYPDVQVSTIQMHTPLNTCIDRNSKRPNPVPENVIKEMYEKASD
jgi:predicted kinase